MFGKKQRKINDLEKLLEYKSKELVQLTELAAKQLKQLKEIENICNDNKQYAGKRCVQIGDIKRVLGVY